MDMAMEDAAIAEDVDLQAPSAKKCRTQRLFVMRHGERRDDADASWTDNRMWDPPLTALGWQQATAAGSHLRSQGVLVSRILVSPFLRCLQTAAGFIKGMFPDGSDSSILKVSIEYGLAELMNRGAIRNPRDSLSIEPWHLPVEELYSVLPCGVVDTSVQSILPELPVWGEDTECGHQRYSKTFFAVADKFLNENILCVSHGEGVATLATHLRPEALVYSVAYCAYSLAEREVFNQITETPSRAGPWRLATELGPESGLLYTDNIV